MRQRTAADDAPSKTEGDNGDFRTRSAARRRTRMRARLLEATMAACAQRGSGAVVIEDVLKAASVSRGTFYSYFDSLQDAINIVAQQWITESVFIYEEMYTDVKDSYLRCAIGLQLLLRRSAIQPAWGATIVQGYEYLAKSQLARAMRADIVRGMRRGVYRRMNVQAAFDLHLGMMARAARTISERKGDALPYIRTLSEGVLMAMGVPLERAQEAVTWATIDLKARGPRHLDWWKDIS